MSFGLKQKREWLVAHYEDPLPDDKVEFLNQLLSRLQTGEPLAYIIGKRSFFGLDFRVTPDVLVPRPETELLVEEAVSWLEANPSRRKMVDVGTGSGIIAISLADRFADLQVTAIDISAPALLVAQENAQLHGLNDRITFKNNDLLSGVEDHFDLITANLPYIPSRTLQTLSVLKHEPRLALDGGEMGLDLIERLLKQAVNCIQPRGLILLEIEASQGQSAPELAKQVFPQAKIECLNDYADLPRVVKILF
jgi:release factor glutamine methyltransferase